MKAPKAAFPPELGVPMAPVSAAKLPGGDNWGYQLKWDGVRLLAVIGKDGRVLLLSRQGLFKNEIYPELTALLESCALTLGPCVLDGELISWTGERPSFQRVLLRERTRGYGGSSVMTELRHPDPGTAPWRGEGIFEGSSGELDGGELGGKELGEALPASEKHRTKGGSPGSSPPSKLPDADGIFSAPPGLVFVLFDILRVGAADLRQLSYVQRHKVLLEMGSLLPAGLLVTELYLDGDALWRWVKAVHWEGVVSKRLDSPYREDKKHRDWLKTKTALLVDVDIVGLKVREGQTASLIMSLDGNYFGSVSLGLTGEMRTLLTSRFVPEDAFANGGSQYGEMPFAGLHSDLRGERIVWLEQPIPCTVTGLEITEAGQLRHPKLAGFGRKG